MSRGSYGFVYLSPEDRARMAKVLGLSEEQFVTQHCTRTEGLLHLNAPDKDCQFLEGKRCGVYEGRPAQCRTWPFWPENMNSRTWNKEVAPFCAGVGKGPLQSADTIQETLDRYKKSEDGLYSDQTGS